VRREKGKGGGEGIILDTEAEGFGDTLMQTRYLKLTPSPV
jgi:hypothetical protein